VRDVLHVDDLIEAMCRAQVKLARVAGRAFNVGGGVDNALSLRDLLDVIRRLHGSVPRCGSDRGGWPTSATTSPTSPPSWRRRAGAPRISAEQGVRELYDSMRETFGERRGPVRTVHAPAQVAARS
jgi:CDP-paratose 2-epimerase